MFESSMKENNELREFTTLERQMFYENVSGVFNYLVSCVFILSLFFVYHYRMNNLKI